MLFITCSYFQSTKVPCDIVYLKDTKQFFFKWWTLPSSVDIKTFFIKVKSQKLQLILEIMLLNPTSYLKSSYSNIWVLAKNFRSAF